jgi:AcrR family transcriptional regulator
MSMRETLLAAALKVLEEGGEAQFSTRAICAVAKVTAPTLYHHYGSADGLLSAAMTEAFAQFLRSKQAAIQSDDPETALREGWDDYVRFAATRPRLYAAMIGRVLQGARIPAAEQAFALLIQQLRAVAGEGRLAAPVEAAADLMWSSVNAASLLYVTARLRDSEPPTRAVVASIREQALLTVLLPKTKEASQ